MFDWPVGTPSDRASAKDKLPGFWENSNPFANYYEIAPDVWNYHDGVDLNLNIPSWNADWHKPVCAIADGQVTFAGVGGGSWGHIIDIKHLLPDGRYVVSRFGHIENPLVKRGDTVTLGQQVASVGNGDGYYGQSGAHLHWNLSKPNDPIMLNLPNQWCGANKQCVLDHYTDPIQFIIDRKKESPMTTVVDATLKSPRRVPIYQIPSLTAYVVRNLASGDTVQVDSAAPKIEQATGIKFYPTPDDLWIPEDCLTLAPIPVPPPTEALQVAVAGLRLRSGPGTTYGYITHYDPPTQVTVADKVVSGSYVWRKVIAPQAGWMAQSYNADIYLKPIPPVIVVVPTKHFDPDYGPQFLYNKYDSQIARKYKYVKVISNPGGLADAHSYHPDGLFIHRTFYDGSIADYINQRGGTPESAADRWMAENAEALATCPWAYHEGMNEQTQTDLEIAFEIARLTRLKAANRKGCVLNRGVGWTSDDLWKRSDMSKLLTLVQEVGIVGVHCYGEGILSSSSGDHFWRQDGSWSVPGDPLPATIDPTQSFHATRVVRDMQIVKSLGFDVQFVGTEVGCDDVSKPWPHNIQTRGWKSCVQIWQAEGWLSNINGGNFYLKTLRWWCDTTKIPGLVYGSGDTTDAGHYPPGVFDTVGLL